MNAASSDLRDDSNSHLAADVGAALREARQRRGQSQRDVATVARTSAGTVSRVERGDPNVALSTVDRIATSLGMHLTFRFYRRIIRP